jgi:hypothetical protein
LFYGGTVKSSADCECAGGRAVRCEPWESDAASPPLWSQANRAKQGFIYAAIPQAKARSGTAEELTPRIKEDVIPIISDVQGFRAYYVVYAPDDAVTAIGIFNNF